MRHRGLFGSLILIAALVIPAVVMAGIPTGPPPGPPPTYSIHSFDCEQCHGADMDLGTVADMICLKCHKSGGAVAPTPPNGWPADGFPRDGVTDREFSSDDASNAMGYNNSATLQTSHNWATPTKYLPAAGAQAPVDSRFATNYGATASKVVCSTCHLPHEDTDNPQLLVMGAGSANAMCLDCHRAWNQGPGNDGVLTHPMVSNYDTTYMGTPGFKATLDNQDRSAVQLVNGTDISCTTCHGVHWVDSDSTTDDGHGQVIKPGDGKLLRANGEQITVTKSGTSTPSGTYATGGSVCTVCHDYETSFHGGSNDIGCLACHGGHNYNNNNPPVYMLNDSTGSYSEVPADDAKKSLAWVGENTGVVDGFCETCHGDILDWDSTRTHVTVYPYEDCTACHGAHAQGSFSQPIGCDGCHGSPPQFDAPGKPGASGFLANGYAYANSAGLTPNDATAAANYPNPYSYKFSDVGSSTANPVYKDETATPHVTHSGASSQYGFRCTVCHNTHINEFNSTHNKGPNSFQDVLQSGYNFATLTNAGGDMSPTYDNSTTLGTCSAVYCHSDGGVNQGDGTRVYGVPYNTARWAGKLDSITGQAGAIRCNACHGNDATEMGSDTHDTHLNAGFSCNHCHFNTATSNIALTASAAGGTHVNGSIDVVFDTTNALKPTGVKVSNGSNPYADAAEMTCQNLYCHSTGQDSVPGDRKFKTLNWDDALPSGASRCVQCHDITTGTDQTVAHAAHINGSGNFVGRDLDCNICHDDTMNAGDYALGQVNGVAYHVNGQVDINMDAAIKAGGGDCSNITCHSDGNYGGSAQASPANPQYNVVAWTAGTGSLLSACDKCHGSDSLDKSYPVYPNAGPGADANSHIKHVEVVGVSCEECHSGTTSDGSSIVSGGTHVNQVINVTNTASLDYNETNDSCTVTCHGVDTPQWGGTVACGSCHAADKTLAESHNEHYNSSTAGKYNVATITGASASAYVIQCGVCHTSNGGDPITHGGGRAADGSGPNYNSAEVKFDGTIASGTYTRGTLGTVVNDPNGFEYSAATCQNLYCHGDFGGNGNNAIATWGVASSGDCGTCHDVDSSASLTGGVHDTHIKYVAENQLNCKSCHGNTAVNAAGGIVDKTTHANQQVEIRFDTTSNFFDGSSTYNGATTVNVAKANVGDDSYNDCNNIYCHSDVQPDGGNGGPTTYKAANWTNPGLGGPGVNCGDCHKGNDASSLMDNGSHTPHVNLGNYAYDCDTCHDQAGTGVMIEHGDYEVDVNINTAFLPSSSAPYGTYNYNGLSSTIAPGDAYTSCSTTYCHSGGRDGSAPFTDAPNKQPVWGGSLVDVTQGTTNCSACHGAKINYDDVIATGSHTAHINNTNKVGDIVGCSKCHDATMSGTGMSIGNVANHVNKLTNVKFQGDFSGFGSVNKDGDAPTYDSSSTTGSIGATKAAGSAFAGCDNVYCHSIGNLDGAQGSVVTAGGADFKPVTWGSAALECDDCHGDDATNKAYPAYTSGAAGSDTANSHEAHVVGASADCSVCHKTTVNSGSIKYNVMTLIPAGTHLDRTETVSFNATVIGSTPTYTAATKTCSTVACHGSGAPVWGGVANCADCHVSSSDDDDYEDNGVPALLAKSEWDSVGHGYNTTYFNASTLGEDPCLWCHDATVGHETNYSSPTNFFRLRGDDYNSAAFGWNGACLVCHDSDETGTYDAEGALTASMDLSTVPKIDKWHQMDAHGQSPNNGGKFCWDCHDPHGDGSNLAMIQAEAAQKTDGTFGIPEVLAPNTYNVVGAPIVFTNKALPVGVGGWAINSASLGSFEQGVCNACHTESAANPKMAHYTATSSDSHNADTVCTNCHKHDNADGINNGFAFAGSGCSGCHGDAATDRYWPDGSDGHPDDDAGRHLKHMRVVANSLTYNALTASGSQQVEMCAYCHPDYSGGLTGTHANNTVDVTSMTVIWNGNPDNATYAGDNCSNVDCHNAKATNAGTGDFAWKGSDPSECIMCHRDVPSDSTHVSHTGLLANVTYGLTQDNCAYCHDSATDWASNTQPASGHISGAFNVTGGSVSVSYDGTYYNATAASSYGSCGVNDCHNNGRNAAAVTAYTWGTNNNVGGCNFCHSTNGVNGTNAHQAHFAGDGTFYSGVGFMDCSKCHTHGGPSADHMSTFINLAGTMNYSSGAALNVATIPVFGTCDTATCHNNGAGTNTVTPKWNTAVVAASSCAICHFASDTGATNEHAAHIDDTAVTSYTAASAKGTNTDEYEFNCANCHGNTLANHIKGTLNYNATVEGDYVTTTAGSCNANQCHNDGTAAMNAAPVDASWTTGWPAGDTDGSCNNCHGNAPATNAHADHDVGIHYDDIYNTAGGLYSDGTNANAHGDSATSTTISCYSCHNETVYAKDNRFGSECSSCHGSGGYASTNVAAAIGNFNKHVNFSREVVFNASTFRTNAQVRDIIDDAAEVGTTWTRYNSSGVENNSGGGYKQTGSYDQANAALSAGSWSSASLSCSNIACHNNIVTPKWNTATVDKGDCMACHTTLPQ